MSQPIPEPQPAAEPHPAAEPQPAAQPQPVVGAQPTPEPPATPVRRRDLRRLARRNFPVLAGGVVLGLGWYWAYTELIQRRPPDVPFVTTPQDVVERMLELAEVRPGEKVYDLGCGDGRIVIAAARRGARGVGVEMNPELVDQARAAADQAGLRDRVTIRRADVLLLDFGDADVVTLYLGATLNARLIPQLERLKPGARVVSHVYGLPGIKPTQKIDVKSAESGMKHTIYLWVAPLQKEEP